MTELHKRIENHDLVRKVMPVEEAVKCVKNGDTIAISGFSKSGEPKTFLPALAKDLRERAPDTRVNVFSGASLSDEVENPLARFIKRRGPYTSSWVSCKLIHEGKMEFTDVHFSQLARDFMYGFYGEIDLAVVEVTSPGQQNWM